jgi:putrescine transport system substrate-binding protein
MKLLQARKLISFNLLVASLLLITSPISAIAAEEKVLNFYNWADYVGEDTIKNFEKETGIKVHADFFDNTETMHTKLVVGHSNYDVVITSGQWGGTEIQGGLLRKLDKSKLPNLKNMDPTMQAKLAKIDPNNDHLVSWLWGYTTVGINVDRVKAALGTTPMPDNAFDLVFNPNYASKLKSCGISFVDTPTDVFAVALHYIGKSAYSKNKADYDDAAKMLKQIRPYIAKFNSVSYIDEMARGSYCVALGWSGDINIARQSALDSKSGIRIEALIPKGGAPLIIDAMAIPKDAPHPNNALLFMNYIMRPEVQAGLTNKVFYANANAASKKFVTKEIVENKTAFLPDADLKRMVAPDTLTNDIRRVMTRLYTTFKSGL